MQDYDISVLGISESWLLSSTPSSFVDIPNYVLFRKNVLGNIPKHGLCMYLRSHLNYMEVNVQIPNVVVAYLLDYDSYIATIYRPPSNLFGDDERLLIFFMNFAWVRM